MCAIFKVFVDFVTILLLVWGLCFVLFYWPQGMWYLSSPTMDQTHTHHAMKSEVLTSGLPGKPPPYSHFIDKETEARRDLCDLLTFM